MAYPARRGNASDELDETEARMPDADTAVPSYRTHQPPLSQASRGHVARIPTQPLAVQAVSYAPTRSSLVNTGLAVIERRTHRRAGLMQRVVTYLFFGGVAALVNLFVFYLLDERIQPSIAGVPHSRYIIAFVVATEISILANFIPQDRVTFSRLPGHSRSWLTRCLRFHLTSLSGTLLTLAISFTLNLLHLRPTLGQAIAIVIVTAYNFTVHHLFTYRHTASAPSTTSTAAR